MGGKETYTNDVVPCGNVVEDDRWEAGYHCHKAAACFRRWGKRQTIYAVAVNKSMEALLKVEGTTLEEEDLAQSA